MTDKHPEKCYQIHPTSELPVVIEFGVDGYKETTWMNKWDKKTLDRMNKGLGVTPEQATVMLALSMTGKWDMFKSAVEKEEARS